VVLNLDLRSENLFLFVGCHNPRTVEIVVENFLFESHQWNSNSFHLSFKIFQGFGFGSSQLSVGFLEPPVEFLSNLSVEIDCLFAQEDTLDEIGILLLESVDEKILEKGGAFALDGLKSFDLYFLDFEDQLTLDLCSFSDQFGDEVEVDAAAVKVDLDASSTVGPIAEERDIGTSSTDAHFLHLVGIGA
jgi:hypothetical protein